MVILSDHGFSLAVSFCLSHGPVLLLTLPCLWTFLYELLFFEVSMCLETQLECVALWLLFLPTACQHGFLRWNLRPGSELGVREGGVRGCLGIWQVTKKVVADGRFLIVWRGKEPLKADTLAPLWLDCEWTKYKCRPEQTRGQTEFIGQFMRSCWREAEAAGHHFLSQSPTTCVHIHKFCAHVKPTRSTSHTQSAPKAIHKHLT